MHVDQNETGEDRFKRLAVARTNKCLATIGHIGNLSSGQYAKSPEQVEAIFGALRDALTASEARFSATKQDGPRFTL